MSCRKDDLCLVAVVLSFRVHAVRQPAQVLPHGWRTAKDMSGRTYYYNVVRVLVGVKGDVAGTRYLALTAVCVYSGDLSCH